jgi:hypothetical protein
MGKAFTVFLRNTDMQQTADRERPRFWLTVAAAARDSACEYGICFRTV